jgi:two-component SAPR family response regulator
LETWPHPVKLYTLGRFELLLNDEPVASSGRVQQKPLELLKAVIAMGGRDVSEAHLTDALWPESDGDAAKNSFDTTLHRLRKLIGNDKTVVFRDGLLGLDPRYCWVDVWAFEQTLCRIEKDEGQGTGAKGEGERVVVTRLAEKAVALYKGHFLPSDARSSWSPSIRERLKSKFLSLIVRLGRQSMENGDCERAMEWFRKGLEIEDHAEEFYQNLMLCQQRLGQEAEVVKTFYRCRAILHKSLGLEPSTKTREIYSSIRRNG